MIHRHRWTTVARHYTPPARFEVDLETRSGGQDLLLSLALGLTGIEQRCSKCGLTKIDTYPGDHRLTKGTP